MEKEHFDLPEGVTAVRLPISDFEKQQTGFTTGFYHLQPYNQVHPRPMIHIVRQLKEFECREDDVWVGSYPKCGIVLQITNVHN